MSGRWLAALGLALVLGVGTPAEAAFGDPGIQAQGVLRDPAGQPLDGTFELVVSLYTTQTGGTPVWTETHPGVTTVGGVFSVLLGSKASLKTPTNLFAAHPTLWMGVRVDGAAELSRVPMVGVGYAYQAQHAEVCEALSGPAPDLSCSGCVDAVELSQAVWTAMDARYPLRTDLKAGSGLTLSGTTYSVTPGGLDASHLADTLQYLSVRNAAGAEQFSVTDGNRALQIVGGGGTTVAFDAASHRVTITSGATGVTQVSTGSGLTGGPITSSGTIAIAPGGVTAAHLAENYVNVTGDTMTGSLTLSAGDLSVAGNAEVGTAAGFQKLTTDDIDMRSASYLTYNGQACRICIGHADNNAFVPGRCMCTSLFTTSNSSSGAMNLAGDVDGNDRLWMRTVCDGGFTGVFTTIGGSYCPW